MARLAVFASGRGTNFVALREYLRGTNHEIPLLVSDNPGSGAVEYANAEGIPVLRVSYRGKRKQQVERRILEELQSRDVDVVALAGYMRILTPLFVRAYAGRIVNIHPSLLPKYRGLEAIRRSFEARDRLGITIHYVDEGVDTGPVIAQHSHQGNPPETLEEAEEAVHTLEHFFYPRAVASVLDSIRDEQASAGHPQSAR